MPNIILGPFLAVLVFFGWFLKVLLGPCRYFHFIFGSITGPFWSIQALLSFFSGPHGPLSSSWSFKVLSKFRVPLRSFCFPFEVLFRTFSGPFQVLFRSFSGPFQVLYRSFSGPFQVLFRSFSSPFPVNFMVLRGVPFGCLWGPFEVLLKTFWGLFQVLFMYFEVLVLPDVPNII
jgi:hypothetical protein